MRLRHEVRKFGGDRRGNVAILFAFSIIPVIITFGVAIDYGRALIAKQRLGAAIDSAALAVGSATDLTEQQVEEIQDVLEILKT